MKLVLSFYISKPVGLIASTEAQAVDLCVQVFDVCYDKKDWTTEIYPYWYIQRKNFSVITEEIA